MLNVFVPGPKGLERLELAPGAAIPEEAIWIDLLDPTPEEEQQVEQALGVDVPTREEMREIETSNRLYEDNGALYLTATVLLQGRHRAAGDHSGDLHPGRLAADHQPLRRSAVVPRLPHLRRDPSDGVRLRHRCC